MRGFTGARANFPHGSEVLHYSLDLIIPGSSRIPGEPGKELSSHKSMGLKLNDVQILFILISGELDNFFYVSLGGFH